MTLESRIGVYLFSTLLFISAGMAAYLSQPYILFIPLAILLAVCLVQWPGYLFYLLIASIPWSFEYTTVNGPGTDLPDEPLMLLVALTTIMLFVDKRKSNLLSHPLTALLLLEFSWIIITMITSTDVILSLKFLLAKTWYLLAFFVAPLYLFRNLKTLKISVIILLISMSAAVVVSLIRHAIHGFTFAEVNDALVPFFRNHVNYGALLVLMVPVVLALIKLQKGKKYLLYIWLLVLLFATYVSYSRGAWLALIIGLMTYWLLKKKKVVVLFVIFVVLSFAFVVGIKTNDRYLAYASDYRTTIFHTNFNEHLIATYRLKDVSTAERFYRWIAGVRMVKDRWQTGYGPSTFNENYKSYTVPLFKTWVSDNKERSTVHNYFLLILIEQGVFGLSLFLVLLGLAFHYAENIYARAKSPFWKELVAAVAVILAMICTVNFLSDLIETDKIGGIFYLCLALLVIADRNANMGSDSAPDIQGIS